MALHRQVSCLMFLCFHVVLHTWTSDAAGSSILQDLNCSTSGNYTATSAYAANVNQFMAALPEEAVSKNGGFYNGTIGEGLNAVYGLAMCPADYSRADCGDCLMAAAGSDADGLPSALVSAQGAPPWPPCLNGASSATPTSASLARLN